MLKLFIFVVSCFFALGVYAAPVNVNKASAEEIAQSLSGIGTVKAQAIVEYRKVHGQFKSVNDLKNVKGIGAKTVENNRADILLKPVE